MPTAQQQDGAQQQSWQLAARAVPSLPQQHSTAQHRSAQHSAAQRSAPQPACTRTALLKRSGASRPWGQVISSVGDLVLMLRPLRLRHAL